MNTYSKILLTTLPLVVFFLFATVGTSYYFSRKALVELGETWLDTRLSEAMEIARNQEKLLHEYGLENIPASISKAQMDTATASAAIKVGKLGYIFAVNIYGTIIFHPNKYLIDTDISSQEWFQAMTSSVGRLIIAMDGNPSLARFAYFKEWEWFILAVDPMEEVYGVTDRMRPYLYSLGLLGAVIISLALMFFTRRLTRPLAALVQGADKIGRGELSTRISIQTKDEFGHLAKEFNQMAARLQETLTAIQMREAYFRSLIENGSDLIWILDKKGKFLYVSPSTQRTLGYLPEELLGKNFFHFLHPEDQASVSQGFNLMTRSHSKARPLEHRFRHKEAYWSTLESVNNNLLDHPAIQGIVVNSRNITKRKMAEQALWRSHEELETRVAERTQNLLVLNQALNQEIQTRKEKEVDLERANQVKTEFLANISHEIRTPLNSIMGFTQVLSGMVTEKQTSGFLTAISLAAKNLLGLINDILDLSKIEAKKLHIHKTPVCLDVLIHESLRLFTLKAREKSLEIFIEIDPGLPKSLLLDEMRFRQVLVNLLDNAVKFTPCGSIRVAINALKKNGSATDFIDLVIQIQDTGIGIPSDKIEIIFDSFQQGSAGTSRKYGGTGLGLSICRQLILLMGGTIRLTSTLGEGSLIEIALPDVEISLQDVATPYHPHGEQKEASTQEILKKNLSPQVMTRLENEILPHLPQLQEGMKIRDIQGIAEDLRRMGSQSQSPALEAFGRELIHHADSFDIEKITLCLKQLSWVLETERKPGAETPNKDPHG